MTKIVASVVGVLITMFIGFASWYIFNNLATKQQVLDLSRKSDTQHIEVSIQINEMSIDTYDQIIQLGGSLGVKQGRRHTALIDSTKELIKQRNELLGL